MSKPALPEAVPGLDLVFERVVDVPRAAIWRAWTTPSQLLEWFCPQPWKTVECEIDLRPGGRFHTVMQSPEGQRFPMTGCYFEVIENERLVWGNAVGPGFRPAEVDGHGPCITAIISLTDEGAGTRYRALALHKNAADCQAHAAMGFEEGWGKALDQMVALIKRG